MQHLLFQTHPNNTGVVIIKHANPCGVSIIKDKLKVINQL